MSEEVFVPEPAQLDAQDRAPSPPSVRGFMCKIDWDYELGEASGGTRVYASITDLKRRHASWEQCGIVEVMVTFVDELPRADK